VITPLERPLQFISCRPDPDGQKGKSSIVTIGGNKILSSGIPCFLSCVFSQKAGLERATSLTMVLKLPPSMAYTIVVQRRHQVIPHN
jgi:hypothetical protein